MSLDKNKLYILILAFSIIYNFMIDKFFIWILELENIIRFMEFQIFFQYFRFDMIYTKVVVHKTIYNFIVEFFYLNSFRNMCFKFIDFEIQNLEFLNNLECLHR
jgi:hypothetical protein